MRITGCNIQLITSRDGKVDVTRASETIFRMVFTTREERPELLMGTSVIDDDEAGRLSVAI